MCFFLASLTQRFSPLHSESNKVLRGKFFSFAGQVALLTSSTRSAVILD